MAKVVITGSAGLVGSECVRHFTALGYDILGLDNKFREYFFGKEASVREKFYEGYWQENVKQLITDVSREDDVMQAFILKAQDAEAVIHCAAQPSHDWAATRPFLDFEINARGTLNLLEATRKYCPRAAFIFCSTNKVYGDRPNEYPYDHPMIGNSMRFERHVSAPDSIVFSPDDPLSQGFNELMPVDHCMHSLFGCSKLAADMYVQEYGRYFGMNTVCFRAGCITGGAHAGAKLHGFLSYLVKCCVTDTPYEVIGYGGRQVRDNIHAADLVSAFECYRKNPRPAAVYNIGGGRENSCSVLEAIALVEEVAGKKMQVTFKDEPRKGDHKWWITDTSRFRRDYPEWKITRNLRSIVEEIVESERRKAAQ